MRVLPLVAIAALAGCGHAHRAELAREPYLGVACRTPGSTACDRVGVAVWLEGRASSVEATVAGTPVSLDPPARGRDYWQGFVQPAGLVSGRLRPATQVRVTVAVDGSEPVSLRTRLHEGWG